MPATVTVELVKASETLGANRQNSLLVQPPRAPSVTQEHGQNTLEPRDGSLDLYLEPAVDKAPTWSLALGNNSWSFWCLLQYAESWMELRSFN